MLASRGVDDLEAARKELKTMNPDRKILTVPTDVASKSDIQNLFDITLKHFGRVDVVVHSAGVLGPVTNIGDSAVEDWWKAFVRSMLHRSRVFSWANDRLCILTGNQYQRCLSCCKRIGVKDRQSGRNSHQHWNSSVIFSQFRTIRLHHV